MIIMPNTYLIASPTFASMACSEDCENLVYNYITTKLQYTNLFMYVETDGTQSFSAVAAVTRLKQINDT